MRLSPCDHDASGSHYHTQPRPPASPGRSMWPRPASDRRVCGNASQSAKVGLFARSGRVGMSDQGHDWATALARSYQLGTGGAEGGEAGVPLRLFASSTSSRIGKVLSCSTVGRPMTASNKNAATLAGEKVGTCC
jgi:hypothetical protein